MQCIEDSRAVESCEEVIYSRAEASRPKESRAEDRVDALQVQDFSSAQANIATGPHGGSTQSSQSKHSFVYRMDYPRRGRAIIINNKDFEPETRMSKRNGTDKDAASLYQWCKSLQFETVLKNNLSTTEMLRLLTDEAKRDHSDEACFMCCILSHGEEGKLYGTDGMINNDTLTESFKGDRCPSLDGKPKIFVIQACRGDKLDDGVEMTDAMPEMEEPQFSHIPSDRDFLMAYSVVPGYYSWRNRMQGSWFIQSFCAVMAEYGEKEEVMTLMTRVNQKVAYDFESHTEKESWNKKKQIPCIMSMLTKQLYFSK